MWKWIRADVPATENEHQEFVHVFETCAPVAALKISSETDYCAFLNGKLVGYGQYHDLESYKVYDEYDLSPLLEKGKNVLAVSAYFEHTPTANYVEKGLGLIFSVTDGDRPLCESGEQTLSRKSKTYESGTTVPLITGQLGYSYRYDFTAEDGWLGGTADGFAPSCIIDKSVQLFPRPIKKTVETKNTARAIRIGTWESGTAYQTVAETMQDSRLCEREADIVFPLADGLDVSENGNVYLLADLGDEKTGILTFDIETPAPCRMFVGYGEHIADRRVRTYIAGRNFSFEFELRAGRNRFTGTFRRLGGRYISLFLENSEAKIYDFNVISTDYPVEEKPRAFSEEKLQRIYDASVKTLRVCMHEHYEDTPWREQALYAMDSRNQMLCGYFAFGNYDFARASLRLLSENIRKDGFFTLTSPKSTAETELTIPCFSLIQFVAMEEYARYSGDLTLFAEYEGNYRAVMENFLSRREKNGLLKAVKGVYRWNFYEWSEGLEGNFLCDPPDRYEAPLNAFLILALRSFVRLLEKIGRYRGEYDEALCSAERAFGAFYDEEKGCWADFMATDGTLSHYTELTNSLAALADVNEKRREKTVALLSKPSFLTPVSLSNGIFKYSALLETNAALYERAVLDEISRVWGGMLDAGASTFFEDAAGEKAFNGAGSLSHGWSAVPVYVLTKIFYAEETEKE